MTMTRNEKVGVGFLVLSALGLVAAAWLGGDDEGGASGPQDKRALYTNHMGKLVKALDGSEHGKEWWRRRIDLLEKIAIKVTPFGGLLKAVYQAENDYFGGKIPKEGRLDYALNLALAN